jgi:rubrerythrin
MSDDLLTVRSVLESCVGREEMSVKLYDRALDVVKDPAARAILKALRDEEAEHVRAFKEALTTGRADLLGQKEVAEKTLSIIPPAKVPLDKTATPVDVLTFAILHEEKSMDYFARYVDAFRGTRLGRLFERLRREEEGHRQKLEVEFQKATARR